uniref:Protein kinase n=1 Tax=Suid herpesvirus 1 TaxID=10345 RepID=B4YQB4_SUHV|nr:protein kinase [Suid alphaherpesvirus 1]
MLAMWRWVTKRSRLRRGHAHLGGNKGVRGICSLYLAGLSRGLSRVHAQRSHAATLADAGIPDEILYSDISDDEIIIDGDGDSSGDEDDDDGGLTRQAASRIATDLGFEVLQPLQSGSEGRVFVARRPGEADTVVLKVGQKPSTLMEGMLLKRLAHDNVMSLKQMLARGPVTCLVLPHFRCDLYSYLTMRDGPLDMRDAGRVIRSVLRGLAYLHGMRIMHRDVKAENIFLEDVDTVCLGDLGAARCNVAAPNFYGLAGTIETNAPEELARDRYDTKVDVWGAGVVLFETLAYPKTITGGDEPAINGEMHLIDLIRALGVHPEEFPPDTRLRSEFVRYAGTHRQPYTQYARVARLGLPETGAFLIYKMLTFDPVRRPSADEILNFGMWTV